jgi:ABC-type transporter Mla subunit MlaD
VNVVESVKAQTAGALATIEGIPQRLEQHEKAIAALVEDVPETVSRTVGERLAADLRQISEHLLRLSTQIETVVAQTRPSGEVARAVEG